jgi:ribosomal protein S18 acetylase RimI-like enzyme
VLEIQALAVAPAQQRRGVGRDLLAAAIEAATERGARRLTLRVLATNAAARRLYSSMGFEVEGVLRGEFLIDGSYVDDVLMAARVGDRPNRAL